MPIEVDVAVVGAGPAGIAAALAAAHAGATVAVVDEYPRVGGQYLRPDLAGAGHRAASTSHRSAAALAHELRVAGERLTPARHGGASHPGAIAGELRAAGVRLVLGAPAWHVDPAGRHLLVGSERVEWRALVLATGAYDRPVAVPGGLLPGVVTAGGAQALAKDGAAIGRRVVVAGSGPFCLPVAVQLLRRGARVKEVALTHPPVTAEALRHAPAIAPEGAAYLARLLRARVRVSVGWRLQAVLGSERAEGAELRRGEAVRTIACDAVAVSDGFLPQLALADLAGCALRFDRVHGTWFVAAGDDLATSVPGVFAAGEMAGIGGHRCASVEGERAGLAAAGRPATAPPALVRRHRRLRRFAAALAPALVAPERPAVADDAVVCRCEGVTAAQIRAAVADGASTPAGVRMRTRAGMGICQARMCGQLVGEIVAERTGTPLERVGRLEGRTPARPLELGTLL